MNRHIPTKNNTSVKSATSHLFAMQISNATKNKFTNAERLKSVVPVAVSYTHLTLPTNREV